MWILGLTGLIQSTILLVKNNEGEGGGLIRGLPVPEELNYELLRNIMLVINIYNAGGHT